MPGERQAWNAALMQALAIVRVMIADVERDHGITDELCTVERQISALWKNDPNPPPISDADVPTREGDLVHTEVGSNGARAWIRRMDGTELEMRVSFHGPPAP